jgi:hypothetical protein
MFFAKASFVLNIRPTANNFHLNVCSEQTPPHHTAAVEFLQRRLSS